MRPENGIIPRLTNVHDADGWSGTQYIEKVHRENFHSEAS